jgi:hypothetical protein
MANKLKKYLFGPLGAADVAASHVGPKIPVESANIDGTEIFAEGSKFTGVWREGNIYGNGIFTTKSGDSVEGKWSNDLLIKARNSDINGIGFGNAPIVSNVDGNLVADNDVSIYIENQFRKLIGLEKVKQEIRQQARFIEVQKLRNDVGLKNSSSPSRHLVFAGNPGTGKTIFARIVAGMYMRLGILKTDNVVELLVTAPLAMVVVTTFFFFSVVVVFFASGDGAAPEELTQPTVTASARAGKTINDRCKRREMVLDIFISTSHGDRTSTESHSMLFRSVVACAPALKVLQNGN